MPRPRCSGVYFVQWGRYIKIGCACDIVARVRALHSAMPEGTLVPLGWMVGSTRKYERVEERVHDALQAHRARGEWFHDTPDVRAFIARHAMPWPGRPR